MSLKITKKKSVYYLKGMINKPTSNLFLNYFRKKLNKKKRIVLNIDETSRIDKTGLNALKEIITKGIKNKKDVYIVGNGCKEIYDDIHQNQTA